MTTIALRPSAGPATGKRGPAFGLGLSVLVHAAVLAWLTQLPPPRTDDKAPAARLQVRLAPPRPALAAPSKADAPPAAVPRKPAARRPQPHPRSDRPAILTVPPTSSQDRPALPPAAASAPAADTDAPPVVDIEAARQAARRIAREDSRNMVALPARKPVVDPNADHQVIDPIEHARRGDCKTAYAGMGILALIPLAKDALTGTGCKW